MSGLNFTDNPQVGDVFFAAYKSYQNFGVKWNQSLEKVFSVGVVEGGKASDTKNSVSGGVAASVFVGVQLDCGGA
jgi:hypothetical protein